VMPMALVRSYETFLPGAGGAGAGLMIALGV
jgi:hypothetical protein